MTKHQSEMKLLKKSGASPEKIAAASVAVDALRSQLAAATAKLEPTVAFPRKAFEDTIVRKMFVIPSFEIHGSVKGLFDLGPPACGLKANIIDIWRKHFVLTENMLEMECTNLTPHAVLKTSGHVDKFTDMMVKDAGTGECLRADHLLEDTIDALLDAPEAAQMSAADAEKHRLVRAQADAYTKDEMFALYQEYGIKGAGGHELSKPFDFNLMFETKIGPEGTSIGYLRPETAQGLFVNFRRLLDFNGKKMPFAAAQVGLGFRNEIAPRGGLLRVREFCMAEIEHFVNPNDKSHPSFKNVAPLVLTLFDRDSQLGTGKPLSMAIGDAVSAGIVNNETLGYFLARTYLFMAKIGMDVQRLRFRQHLQSEMAHYAADCWDLEIHTSYGWIECVGLADRACYDLMVHAKATNTSMEAAQRLDAPKMVDVIKVEPNKKAIGKSFKGDQKKVLAALDDLAADAGACGAFEAALLARGRADVGGFTLEAADVTFSRSRKEVQEEKFLPSVIEPSFGMGRILYALLEHSFSQDPEDEQRVVMAFNAAVAPCKCHVFPLQTNDKFGPLVAQVADLLMAAGLANKVDASGQSIGRRYARADEVGTPYGVTVDFDTCADATVTLRDRDSQAQVRLPIAEVASTVKALVDGALSWAATVAKYSTGAAADEDEDEMDLGFDDDDDAPAAAVVHAPGSRGALAAEAKAKRDAETEVKKQEAMARLAKKEANQRSLCNLEIKPWEASQDLKALYAKIKATVVLDGLKWSENCALVDVAFGVQKIVCTAVIPLSLSMDAIIDDMTEETFVDEIQSMNMTSMSLL